MSQIVKNRQRQSAEGLSILMFVLTITANLCTGFSIVLRLHDSEALKDQLPWLCGTFGTIALDVTLFYQTLTYGRIAAAHAAAQGAHKQEGDVHGHHHHHHHHHHAHGRHQGSHAFSNPASSKNTGETSATGMFASMPVLGSLAPSNDRSGQQNDLEAPLLLNSHASD